MPLRFKIATEPSEIEQIHRLNHATFAEEIPQHPRHDDGLLVDRFHDQNTYVIALDGDRLAGMLALRGARPFSLDSKLEDLDGHLPAGRSVCEIRLLAVPPAYRKGPVFRGLLRLAAEHGLRQGWDLAVISGTVRQLKLYGHLGFQPFGPRVGTAEAVWAAHCETSTGVLNDLERLKRLGKRLYLDCISSIGTVPVNLSGVRLASGVSGKGLRSFAGISMVFHDHEILPSADLPRYLDLGCYREVPYTVCSNLVAALRAALDRPERFTRIADLSSWLRAALREQGLRILAPDEHASPAVITIVLPPDVDSCQIGRALEEKCYELSYASAYLRERSWIQVCLMGEHGREELEPLPRLLRSILPAWKCHETDAPGGCDRLPA